MSLIYFKYGSYVHPAGEVIPESFGTEINRNDETFQVVSVSRVMSIRVNVIADGDVAVNQRVGEIERAYGVDGGDAAFFLTTGARSHLYISSGDSAYGTIVEGPIWRVNPADADFVTGISCSITIRAEYRPFGISLATKSRVSEEYNVSGNGGPEYTVVKLDNGFPQIRQIYPSTPVYMTQSGTASFDLLSNQTPQYPDYNPPLFPGAILSPESDISLTRTRERVRNIGRVPYTSSWRYNFTFARPPFIPNP